MMVSHNKEREGRLDCEHIIHDAQVCRHAFSLERSLQAHVTQHTFIHFLLQSIMCVFFSQTKLLLFSVTLHRQPYTRNLLIYN